VSRIRVGVVFGGPTRENGVAFYSARCLLENLPGDRYETVPLFVGKDGLWHEPDASAQKMREEFARPDNGLLLDGIKPGSELARPDAIIESFLSAHRAARVDVMFPIVHGTFGEDGVYQGLFESLNIPYVGCGVSASAVGLDKILMKAAFASAGLPQVHYVPVSRNDWGSGGRRHLLEERLEMMPLPLFVKPSCAGSSVGVTKVKKMDDLQKAIAFALEMDTKAIVEEGVDAREIECSVLEGEAGESAQASLPGEVIPGHEFYDYEDKYIDNKSGSVIPAELPVELIEEIRALAVAAFDAIGGAGFARVDFFLERGTGKVLLNEINSLPGFTPISMYPKMWEATGISLPVLLDKLVQSAFQRPVRGR
jgi:D-alanine-D-alanine ligase